MKAIAVAVLLCLLGTACAEPLPPLSEGMEWKRFEDRGLPTRNFPFSTFVLRRHLREAHEQGDSAEVAATLQQLVRIGYVPTDATLHQLKNHLSEAELSALTARFAARLSPVASSRVVDTIPAEHRLVEGIVWDARGKRLFASTVVGRSLLVRKQEGWRKVGGLDTGSLFGLAIDRRRNLLWAASGRVEQTPSPETAFRGLIAVDLRTLREVRRLPAPEGGSPGDIAVGPDGAVYASDPLSGAVYKANPGDAALSVLVPAGQLHNPQGLAFGPDERRLFVSDYVQGLALINLSDGKLLSVGPGAGTMLDGIDGLFTFEHGLVAIQNGTRPRRILFLVIHASGDWITYAKVLERNHPDWGEPTLGTVRGGAFLYIADAQWDRFGQGGAPAGDRSPAATEIRLVRPFD